MRKAISSSRMPAPPAMRSLPRHILTNAEGWFSGSKKSISAPEFRGNGLGKEFFDYLETEYKSVSRFRLELEPGNEKAERLYRRLGFEPLDYRQMVKEKKLP